jgi:hypothetical protein
MYQPKWSKLFSFTPVWLTEWCGENTDKLNIEEFGRLCFEIYRSSINYWKTGVLNALNFIKS